MELKNEATKQSGPARALKRRKSKFMSSKGRDAPMTA